MSHNEFSASASALGYLFQVRYALYLLLSAEREDIELSLEQLDDVAFEQDGSAIELLQLKHHIGRKAKLTNSSKDLWKTIRVWSEYIKKNGRLSNVLLTLVTTASAPDNDTSIAKLLRPSPTRDLKYIDEQLLSIAENSANEDLKSAFTSFVDLDEDERESLISSIRILDDSPSIIDTRDKIKTKLFVRHNHKDAVLDRLEGWWFGRVIQQMSDSTIRISRFELMDQIVDIAEQFRDDALPIDFLNSVPPSDPDPHNDQRLFVHQLREIALSNKQIELAITDYYRAFEQRSRWQREKLVNLQELEDYEQRLVEEVEREREWIGFDPDDESSMKQHGQQLYRWAEQADLRIRPQVTAPYVMRGSYQMIANADLPRIVWHPQFVDRLRATVDIPEPQSDWELRPIETANLFNPAFGAKLIRDAVKAFSTVNDEGMPFALLFLYLPIILHKPTRELLPRSVRKKLHDWIEGNPSVRIDFAKRARDMKKITRESLAFAISKEVIAITDEGYLIATSKRLQTSKNTQTLSYQRDEMKDIERSVKLLGRWFAQSGRISTIFILWGIRP